LRIELANTKKLQMTTYAFLTKMQRIVDALAAGEPICTREHISFILAGLGVSYNTVVVALGAGTTPLTLASLYAQVRAYDQLQEMLGGTVASEFETSTNIAQCHGLGCYSNRSCCDYSDRGDYTDRHDMCRDDGVMIAAMIVFLTNDGEADEHPLEGAWPWMWKALHHAMDKCDVPNLQQGGSRRQRLLVAFPTG
jgi:hypothetical protein